ncbi:MAG: hypothetical protein QM757_17135 [Paludibaculum sp.]
MSGGAPPLGFTIVNAASRAVQAVAPGEIVSVLGMNLGPAGEAWAGADAGGNLPVEAAGVRLLIDGIPAPLISASQSEILAMAPFEIEGRPFVEVRLEFQGVRTVLGGVPVAASAPGLYTADSTGQGQAKALNCDGSENSSRSPANPGSVITLLATGLGATTPPGETGSIADGGRKSLVLPLLATIGGTDAVVVDVRQVAGQPEGLFEVEVLVPEAVASGPAVPVVLRAGTASSADGVTIAVR